MSDETNYQNEDLLKDEELLASVASKLDLIAEQQLEDGSLLGALKQQVQSSMAKIALLNAFLCSTIIPNLNIALQLESQIDDQLLEPFPDIQTQTREARITLADALEKFQEMVENLDICNAKLALINKGLSNLLGEDDDSPMSIVNSYYEGREKLDQQWISIKNEFSRLSMAIVESLS